MSPEARLLAHWAASARTGRRQRGKKWYPTARAWAESLANETGRTLEQVVAVLAITSLAAQLQTNLTWTEAIIRGEIETAGRFPNSNRPKIAAVLANPQAATDYVTGPKVGPFHHAILGDSTALVLDRWAIFAATGERSDEHLNKITGTKRREAIELAYHTVAKRVGLTVRDFQAAIWLQVRETTPKAGSLVAPRLVDITS